MTIKIEMTHMPDAEALSVVHHACFDVGWGAAAIAGLLSVPGTMAFIAEKNAGFGLLRCLSENAEILTVAVLPEYRGQGMASAILGAMKRWALEQGAMTIILEVGQDNEAALGLYEKGGFLQLSRREDYYLHADGSRGAALVMHTLLK